MALSLSRRDGIPADNNVDSILITTGVLTGISAFVVLLRFFVRTVMLKSVGADDAVMALTLACSIAVMVFWVKETETGFGWHIEDINPAQAQRLGMYMVIHGIINMNAVTFVKISVAFNLRRFMQAKGQRMFLLGLIIFLVCFTIMCSCTILFACIPVQASWDPTLRPTAKCFSLKTFTNLGINNSVFNVLTDFLLALLPIPVIIKLHTNLRTKITLGMILSLGFFAAAAGIVKAVKQVQFFSVRDYTWDADFFKWHDIEMNVGIVAASLPALRPLFAKFYDKTLKYTYGAASRMGYQSRNGYAKGYAQGSHDAYERQKNIQDGIYPKGTNTDIALRSLGDEREVFGGKRLPQTHTTEITGGSGHNHYRPSVKQSRHGSHGRAEDMMSRSATTASDGYESDEIALKKAASAVAKTDGVYGHGPAEELGGMGITKTTSVHIRRH